MIAWTLFLWISRLRNVLGNDELTSNGRAIRIGVVVIFVVLALAAAASVLRRLPANVGSKVINFFLLWTFGYWLIRGIGILMDGDYSVGFKAVHTVLMGVSITLSALTARQLLLRR